MHAEQRMIQMNAEESVPRTPARGLRDQTVKNRGQIKSWGLREDNLDVYNYSYHPSIHCFKPFK